MVRTIAVAVLAGLAYAVTAAGADPATPEATDAAILAEVKSRSEIMKNLKYISDVIGPRLTGSPQLEKANNWTAEKMREYGLTSVRLEPWEIPVGWQRGTASVKLLEPTERQLLVASAGWTPSTKGKVTGPVVVVDARTKADLEKYKGKLKNAVILRAPPSDVPGVQTTGARQRAAAPAPAPVGEKKDEPKKDETKKDEAKKDEPKKEEPKRDGPPRGGFGEMRALMAEMDAFFKTEGVAATVRDSGKPHGLLVTTGGWRSGDRAAEQEGIVSLFMAHEHYAQLYRLVKEHKLTPTVEIEVTNKLTPGPITVYNTVGEIVGSEKPDEFVVIGAHLDSWDLASGTTDNGTGSSIVLECARTLAALAKQGVRPKRTIRFVLFTGEEQGLHGSKQYIAKHMDEMPKTSVALVHDTGTGKVTGFGLLGRTEVKKALGTQLDILNALGFEGLTMGGIRGGTDHYSFDQVGVPGFACNQDSDEYLFTHHTQSDTFDKAKEPNLIQGAQVLCVTAMRVANLPELLPRNDSDKEKWEKAQKKK